MSKVVTIVLLVLINLFPFSQNVFASEDCSASVVGGITYSPKAFSPPNPTGSNLTLTFTIGSSNAANNLKGSVVRLHYITPFFSGIGGIGAENTDEVTINGNTFPITLKPGVTQGGEHQAVIEKQKPDGGFEEYCQGIKYTVGDPDACLIDPTLQTSIPPGNKLTIKFSGKPNTDYLLRAAPTKQLSGYIGPITTNSSGQGQFIDVPIGGVNGDIAEISIHLKILLNTPGSAKCSRNITISNSGPPPGTPPPGPVSTPIPGTSTGSSGKAVLPIIPAIAGGVPCGDDNHPAIKTAIGCIPTNPTEFIQASLKFILGIAGGLAFLMMLLAAFQMLTSAGNPDTLKAGSDRLTSAIIGLLFIIFSVLFLQIIGANILAIPGFK